MVAACLQLLGQLQQQTNIVNSLESRLFEEYMSHINSALKNQNPAVKKQGEGLFKTLYLEFGEAVVKKLDNQKP